MSNCSVIPTWMEKRSSICTTPQTPGSPASLSSGFREPLLGEKNHVTSFWHRLSGKSSASSDNISAHMLRLNMESNGHMDDHEIDKRSVLRYELSYEKTQTNCFCGNITFQLRYDFIHRVLMLHVIRANHLPTTDKNGAPDPYIKMYCLPERRNHCKTRIYKKSSDPEFNEMFSFDVPYSNLSSRMLQFTVYDFDRFTRHGLIGNIIMRDLFDKSDLYNWTEYTMQIVGSQEKNDYGDLLLYLAYSVLDKKLYITVAKAYNLRPMDITGASDPYVKISQIYQHKKVKCKRTSMKRANLNPVYHEILEFDLSPGQADETNMLVEVMDWDRIGSDDLLGCCILGNESPTKEGRQQWEQVFSSVRCASSMSEGYQNGTPANGRKASEGHRDSNFSVTTMPKAVGTWHSILEEVPEEYRNIPKAKK
uniref:C2 domain-containing protein n=1 Tax=Acrobeloides nanus TaxID=290746 RepID=A0A914E7E6_9BILA